jgi:hypothetical protein
VGRGEKRQWGERASDVTSCRLSRDNGRRIEFVVCVQSRRVRSEFSGVKRKAEGGVDDVTATHVGLEK